MCNIGLIWLKICYCFELIKKKKSKLSIPTLEFELKYVTIHVVFALISLLIYMGFNILIFNNSLSYLFLVFVILMVFIDVLKLKHLLQMLY